MLWYVEANWFFMWLFPQNFYDINRCRTIVFTRASFDANIRYCTTDKNVCSPKLVASDRIGNYILFESMVEYLFFHRYMNYHKPRHYLNISVLTNLVYSKQDSSLFSLDYWKTANTFNDAIVPFLTILKTSASRIPLWNSFPLSLNHFKQSLKLKGTNWKSNQDVRRLKHSLTNVNPKKNELFESMNSVHKE